MVFADEESVFILELVMDERSDQFTDLLGVLISTFAGDHADTVIADRAYVFALTHAAVQQRMPWTQTQKSLRLGNKAARETCSCIGTCIVSVRRSCWTRLLRARSTCSDPLDQLFVNRVSALCFSMNALDSRYARTFEYSIYLSKRLKKN